MPGLRNLRTFQYVPLAAFSVCLVGGAHAADFDISNGQTATTTQAMDSHETGTVESGGTISVAGVSIYAIDVAGSNNTVTINIGGQLYTAGQNGYAINIFGISNTVTMAGSINTGGDNGSGIVAGDGTSSTNGNRISFSGSILATGSDANGIDLGKYGQLTIDAGATIDVTKDAILALNGNASIYNAGTITSSGYAVVELVGTGNTLTNSGTINAVSDNAWGLITYQAGNTITNSGTISTTGQDDGGIVTSDGTSASDRDVVTIANGGVVKTSGDNSNGVNLGDYASLSIERGGAIETSGIGSTAVLATNNATITTRGTISSQTTAIKIEGTGNTVEFDKGTIISGAILLESPDNSFIIGPGLNALLTITDNLPDSMSGVDYSSCNSGTCTLVSVDTTGFVLAGEMLSDMTDEVFDIVGGAQELRGTEADDVADAGSVISPAGERLAGRSAVWAKAFGNYRSQSDEESIAASHGEVAGLVSGIGGWISPEAKAGVFLGASSGRLSVKSSQSIDWQSWFGGLYAGRSLGEGSQAGLTLLGGVTSYNSSRDVVDNTVASGFTVAKADYTGAFLSPELSLSRDFGPVKGRIAARYAALFLDGYEEDGSSADLKVPSRTVEMAGLSARLAIPRKLTPALTLEPYVGMEGRYSSNPDIDAEVIDISQAVTLNGGGNSTAMRLKAGSSLGYGTPDGTFRWRAALEGATSTDGAVLANVSLSGEWKF